MKAALAVLAGFFVCGAAFAASAEPASYVVTIKRVELSRDGGATFTTAGAGARSSTIRSSDSSGAIVGAYASGAEVEKASYDAVRVTLSNSIGLSGRVVQNAGLNAGTTFCTGGATGAGCAPALVNVTLTNALVGLYGLALPAGTTISDAAGEIVVVDRSFRYDGASPGQTSYRLTFATSSALVIEPDDTIHPAVPVVTVVKNA